MSVFADLLRVFRDETIDTALVCESYEAIKTGEEGKGGPALTEGKCL